MKYQAAGYLRLSNEDGDKVESNSISSQRAIIEKYVENHSEMELVGFYVDDGYTGTNFMRPQIQELFSDLEKGKCNCVIVKDLSRFGRDYIEVGRYLEKYFPAHDIRFVAINDGYDNLTANENDDLMMPIKNLFNSQYSKDISRKVRSAFRVKQAQGEFVGAFASYGYYKDPNDRHKLLIDEEAAVIVRRIFSMYNSGMGKISIAKKLNEEGVPCPSEYKKLKGLNYRNAKRLEYTNYWTYATIARMLENAIYKGDMVQNRTIRKNVRGNSKKLPKSEWIVKERTHEAIIDESVWKTTQELLKHRTRQLDFESEIGLFSGYIKCGDCKRSFAKIKRKNQTYYVCGSYKRYSKKICSSHEVAESTLERLILEKINEELVKVAEIEIPKIMYRKNTFDKKPYQIRLEQIYKLKKELYEDYKQGVLEKEDYLAYKNDYQEEEIRIKGQLSALEEKNEDDVLKNEWIENLKQYRMLTKLDRKTLACVLDSITVFETEDEKIVDIKLKYSL